jgi:hypothetical protein
VSFLLTALLVYVLVLWWRGTPAKEAYAVFLGIGFLLCLLEAPTYIRELPRRYQPSAWTWYGVVVVGLIGAVVLLWWMRSQGMSTTEQAVLARRAAEAYSIVALGVVALTSIWRFLANGRADADPPA